KVVTASNSSVSMIAWTAPKDTFVKLNTDGACKINTAAGCGGCKWFGMDPCKVILVLLAKQIWRLLALDWIVEIEHSYREAKMCADALANIGCSLGEEMIFFDVCPPQIREICEKDRMGFPTPRLILM
ncbi:ribonuclease H, partial [Trifolium medium]|nr:ribonuclease H [Trifolium medium]